MYIFSKYFKEDVYEIKYVLNTIWKGIQKLMATVTDLDAALAAEGTAITALTAAVTALEAKIAAGAPPADLSPEVAQIRAFTDALNAVTAGATPAPDVTPPAAPPAS